MRSILLTGGTGTLGRVVHGRMLHAGHQVRVLSRRSHAEPGFVQGDLRTGGGIAAAVAGVDTIVHCASGSRGDVDAARHLVDAAKGAQPHLIYISIVGVDRIPMFYYRAKLRTEQVVVDSGLPWTILRATQFHNLVLSMFARQHRLPVLFAPAFSFQPVDVRDVAARLTELVTAGPTGRAADIGGPQVRTAAELATAYLVRAGLRQRIVNLRLPGRTFAGYRAGHHLAPGNPAGEITFEQFLSEW